MACTRPQITVLVPTFNRADYLGTCLDSMFGQTIQPAQLIVVDDASSDQTASVLDSYGGRIDRLCSDQLGKSGAVNVGLDKVRGDYLWIFDDDDVALPDALERLVKPLEDHPEHGFSFGTFYVSKCGRNPSGIGRVVGESKIPDLVERGPLIPLLEWNFLGSGALFVRTAVYRVVGYFDPILLRSQDYEMAIRIARRFSGIQVAGGPTFYSRQHSGDRGPLRDQFPARRNRAKWLEYTQIFFRRLRAELPLDDFLPPGRELASSRRLAYLQRAAIMARKSLVAEALADLALAAESCDGSSIDPIERRVLRQMLTADGNFMGIGVSGRPEARAAMLRALPSPPLGSALRRELHWAPLVRRYRRYRRRAARAARWPRRVWPSRL